jgi:hypothetical protein
MEHSLHLGAGHFVKAVAPTSSHKIMKKVDQLSANLADIEDGDENGSSNDDDDSGVGYEVADSIGKSLALVKQVSIYLLSSFRIS